MTAARARAALRRLADPKKAVFLARFFRTGKGEYAEGDRFIGVVVPQVRAVARTFREMPLAEVADLLRSPVHEERLLALCLLVNRFERGDEKERERVFRLYCGLRRFINNWDLVDVSAGQVLGGYLRNRSRKLLHDWARSPRLWERRLAIIATFPFIRSGDFADTLAIARTLVEDEHDLIHKAVGWMLREVGKRDPAAEERFLARHYRRMPRTMLRYAIEKFPEKRRRAYLKGLV